MEKTTIQVDLRTLLLLKKLKDDLKTKSYDETINKLANIKIKSELESLSGVLNKKPLKEILRDLRDEDDKF